MFKKSFSFEGRIRRTEYGLSFIIYLCLLTIIQMIFVDDSNPSNTSPLFLILAIPIIWFLISQGAKRCHDMGNSGWFQLIPFYFFWMLFADSNVGANEYGPNPKDSGNVNEIDEIGKYLNK
ncbi:MAG: DUF805 domain-containing protein [Ferruginibacter sp.]